MRRASRACAITPLKHREAQRRFSPEESPGRDGGRRCSNASPAALAIEHARLFAGLSESYGAGAALRVDACGHSGARGLDSKLVDAYRAAGFERIDVPAVPQDHLAVELRFMALLAAQESAAWDAS